MQTMQMEEYEVAFGVLGLGKNTGQKAKRIEGVLNTDRKLKRMIGLVCRREIRRIMLEELAHYQKTHSIR